MIKTNVYPAEFKESVIKLQLSLSDLWLKQLKLDIRLIQLIYYHAMILILIKSC